MKKARTKPMQVDTTRPALPAPAAPVAPVAPAVLGRVLVIDADPATSLAASQAVAGSAVIIGAAASLREAIERPDLGQYDVILLAAREPADLDDAALRLREARISGRLVVVAATNDFQLAVQAMRLGAIDCLTTPLEKADLRVRLFDAVHHAQSDRRQQERFDQLKRICKRMNTTRIDVTNQVDSLCNDLVHAYQELTVQISHVTAVAEFAAVIRQELDVEELLRTTLEYLLRKLGPTNAAIFLPAAGDDFTLGAYINYNCSKDAGQFLLEHLADVIAPIMVEETDLIEFIDEQSLTDWMGEDAAFLADSHVLTFSCLHEGECLAIFMLWRDITTPFAPDLVKMLRALSAVFTRQLAHVIHVHHRHLPNDQWPPSFDSDMDSDGFDA